MTLFRKQRVIFDIGDGLIEFIFRAVFIDTRFNNLPSHHDKQQTMFLEMYLGYI